MYLKVIIGTLLRFKVYSLIKAQKAFGWAIRIREKSKVGQSISEDSVV